MPAKGSRAGRIVAGNALDDETVFAVATHTDCLNVQLGGIRSLHYGRSAGSSGERAPMGFPTRTADAMLPTIQG